MIAVHRSTVRLKQSSRDARKADGLVAAAATESLSVVPLVQAYGLEAAQRSQFDDLSGTSLRAGLESARVQARFSPLVDVTAALAAAWSQPASAADTWPAARPITVVVPFPPGGGTDAFARPLSVTLAKALDQRIVIDNRGGAGGLIGTEAAAKSAPDGNTMLFTITTHVQTPVVLRRFPYDPVNDFAPIGKLGVTPLVLCASPSTQGNTLQDFVAWARGYADQTEADHAALVAAIASGCLPSEPGV